MPLILFDHKPYDYFISAKRNHLLPTDDLGEGQRCAVTSADPSTVKLSPDAEPRKGPDGEPNIASGKVIIADPAASPSKSIVVISHISEAKGAHAKDANGEVITDAVDTVTFVQGPGVAIGSLFGVPAVTRRN